MGSIWVKEFTGGLDTRRLPETTPGGVLIRGRDGHITRGGEFEKRAAFIATHTLPGGTVGLAYDKRGLVVFGSAVQPAGMPAGVRYQRLVHPDGAALVSVLSHDLYDSKLYVVGQFANGSIYHFYNGVIVADWFDGRARVAFTVIGGAGADEMTDLEIGGVSVFTNPVSWATSNAATAAAIAVEINGTTSSPNYTATAVGATVNVVAATSGPGPNGLIVLPTLTGAFTVSPVTGLVLAGGDVTGGSPATTTFRIAGSAPAATILVTVDGVDLTAAAVVCGASDAATAVALAAAINAHTSVPNYTAAVVEPAGIVLTTATNTDAVNGLSPTFTFTGLDATGGAPAVAAFTISGVSVVGTARDSGGEYDYPINSRITPRVNGVSLVAAAVAASSGSASALATAVAAAINAHTSTPNYTAAVSGATVTVTTATNTDDVNGVGFTFTIQGVVTVSGTTTFSGGADALPAGTAVADVVAFAGGGLDDAFVPGAFVKTVGSKVYSTAGSILHFSGVSAPTQWTTDAVGAGFLNMAASNSGSETLTSLARYQGFLAVFSEEVVQIVFIDPDPVLTVPRQVLGNTGTFAPRSVTQFGDADVFYLDASGVRSLRARDSSNAASTTDIGVPVDSLIVAKIATLTDTERRRIVGLINPIDKRFWLIVKDEIFVFSFFQNAKVSAWTTYTTTARVDDETLAFDAEQAVIFGQRPYIRSGDVVFVYGGVSGALRYDRTQPEAWLPYLDADRPTAAKEWEGIDAALTGTWEVSAAMQPTNLEAEEVLARIGETTYNRYRIAFQHMCSHVSLRFRGAGDGPAVLSAAVLHFRGGEDEE